MIPGNPRACTDDANPRAFVVALARDRLPEGAFAVQLDAEDPPGAPRSAPGDGDLTRPEPSPATTNRSRSGPLRGRRRGYRVEPGGVLEPGPSHRPPTRHRAHDSLRAQRSPRPRVVRRLTVGLDLELLLEAEPARMTAASAGPTTTRRPALPRASTASRAWARSATMSSGCSRPTDTRIVPGPMPLAVQLLGREVDVGGRRRVGHERLGPAQRRRHLGQLDRLDEPCGRPRAAGARRSTAARPAAPSAAWPGRTAGATPAPGSGPTSTFGVRLEPLGQRRRGLGLAARSGPAGCGCRAGR